MYKILKIGTPSQTNTRLNPNGIITDDTILDGENQALNFINKSYWYKTALRLRRIYYRL